MICNSCMTELSGTPKFCPKCGVRIELPSESAPAIKRCPQCGTDNQLGAKFCKKDGYRFEDAGEPAPQSARKTEISHSPPPAVVTVDTLVAVAPTAQAIPSEPEAIRLPMAAPPEMLLSKTPDSAGMVRPESYAETGPAPLEPIQREAKASSKGLVAGIVGAVAVAAAGAGGYMYWSGSRAEHQQPTAVSNAPPAAFASAPTLDTKPPVAESAPSVSPPQAAMASSVGTAPKINVAKIQQELDQRLQSAGFGAINSSVNADGSVNLDGTVVSKKLKDEVVQLALSLYGVERINDGGLQVVPSAKTTSPPPPRVAVPPQAPQVAPGLKPDPAKLEGDINRALRSGGVGGVTAQVGDDFTVTLKGSATSVAEKSRAFQITHQFRGIGATKDRIFVVE